MAFRPTLCVTFAFASCLLASAGALAADPPAPTGAVEPTDGAVVVPATEPAPAPADTTTAAPETAAATPVDATPAPVDATTAPVIEDPYYPPPEPYVPYEPEPQRRTTLKLQSGYFGFGVAPGMTLHSSGFHVLSRFEMEFGGTLEHRYRDLALSFGAALHVTPYFGRKAPAGGVDITSTTLLGPIYIRTGLGVVAGLPRGKSLANPPLPAVGGVVGIGLNFGREPMVKVGVDYDLRVNTKLEPVHTVLLVLRVACCRKD